MDAFYPGFGRNIRRLRQARGLTQEALAQRVGMSRTTITNVEAGRQHVPLHALIWIAEALKVRPAELLPDVRPPILDQVRPQDVPDVRKILEAHQEAAKGGGI